MLVGFKKRVPNQQPRRNLHGITAHLGGIHKPPRAVGKTQSHIFWQFFNHKTRRYGQRNGDNFFYGYAKINRKSNYTKRNERRNCGLAQTQNESIER